MWWLPPLRSVVAMPTITTSSNTASAPDRTTSAARTDDLTQVYGSGTAAVRALDGVSVDFATGRFTAIMGPSGSGTSTLMHCVAGLETPTSGRVFPGKTELNRMSDRAITPTRRKRVGFIFQAFNLLPMLTAEQNVGLTRGQLRGSVPIEAGLLALVGALAGAVRGIGYGYAGAHALLAEFTTVPLAIPWGRLLLVAAVALVAGVSPAWLPSRRAARVAPATALAWSHPPPPRLASEPAVLGTTGGPHARGGRSRNGGNGATERGYRRPMPRVLRQGRRLADRSRSRSWRECVSVPQVWTRSPRPGSR
jgi:hypothetical protein